MIVRKEYGKQSKIIKTRITITVIKNDFQRRILMKYLKITLHDKDFYNELEQLGEYLLNRITNDENFDIENVNIDALKNLLLNLLQLSMYSIAIYGSKNLNIAMKTMSSPTDLHWI